MMLQVSTASVPPLAENEDQQSDSDKDSQSDSEDDVDSNHGRGSTRLTGLELPQIQDIKHHVSTLVSKHVRSIELISVAE